MASQRPDGNVARRPIGIAPAPPHRRHTVDGEHDLLAGRSLAHARHPEAWPNAARLPRHRCTPFPIPFVSPDEGDRQAMQLHTRAALLLTLMFPFTCAVSAQETTATTATQASTATSAATTTTTAPTAAAPVATASTEPQGDESEELRGSEKTREQFSTILRQSPPEVGTILALDPTLLSNESFLAPYPELVAFIAAHPEVRHNPRYYLGEFRSDHRGELDWIVEPLMILFMTALFAAALSWLIRTLIEQKRWNRLSRTQSDVHNKILDRFGTTSELLEYIRTPAGTKFLESAPIPLRAADATPGAPVSRVLWSIQIGVIVAAAAIGLLIVSARYSGETGRGLFGMAVVTLCIGGGFVGSALLSIFLSRRLGVWQTPAAPDAAE
jgi:hypothetical protein